MTKIKLGFEEDKRLKLKFRNIPVSIHYEGKVIHFKSKLEYRWANHLELLKQAGEIKGWSYETHTFVFDNVGLRNWKVDFEVRNNDDTFEYFEAKGKLRKSDIDKLKLLNRDRPEVEVTYVFARKPKISVQKWLKLVRYCKRVIIDANTICKKEPTLLKIKQNPKRR